MDALLDILKTYSIVNNFMLRPPKSSYAIATFDGIEAAACPGDSGGQDQDRAAIHGIMSAASGETQIVTEEVSVVRSNSASVSLHIVFIPHTTAQGNKTVELHTPSPLRPPTPCLYMKHRHSRYLTIFFHGNACDVGYPSSAMLELYALTVQTSILAVEYPGYGVFPGKACEAGMKLAAANVVHYLFGTRKDGSAAPLALDQVVIMGQSIGGGVAMHAVATTEKYYGPGLGGVVLKSTFTSVKNVITNNAEMKASVTTELDKASDDGFSNVSPDDERSLVYATSATTAQRRTARPDPPATSSTSDYIPEDAHAPASNSATADDTPFIYRYGQHVIADRFRNVDVFKSLSHRFGSTGTPLLLLHGMADDVIHFHHSVINYHVARKDPSHQWLDVPPRCFGAARSATPRPMQAVELVLFPKVGHNNIVALPEIISFYRKLPKHGESFDSSPVAPSDAFEQGLVGTRAASACFTRLKCIRWHWSAVWHVVTLMGAAFIFLQGVVMHPAQCSDVLPHVVGWSAVEALSLVAIAWLSWNSDKYGLVSDEPKLPYLLARIIVYFVVGINSMILLPFWIRSTQWASVPLTASSFCGPVQRGVYWVACLGHYLHLLWSVVRNK